MIHSRILGACLICFFMTACNTQEQNAPVNKTTKIKTVTEKPVKPDTSEQKTVKPETATIKTRPALNLSIENISVEKQGNDNDSFIKDNESTEENSALFEKLNKNQAKPGVNLSGKLYTDKYKLENREYLNSVEGVQINIEGSFN